MAQQLEDLIKQFSLMSNEEKIDLIKNIRKGRTIERPAAKRREHEAKRPERAKARKLLDGLSPEQLQLVMTKLKDVK